MIKRAVLLLLLTTLPTLSLAATTQVNATWDKPTTRTDASALDPADFLYRVRIYVGQCSVGACDGNNTVGSEVYLTGATEQVFMRALNNFITDWMTVEIVVIDTLGQESAPESAQFDISFTADNGVADPNPVTNMLIEIET